MNFDWLAWSNPVAIWWSFLLVVSVANISLWLVLRRQFQRRPPSEQYGTVRVELMVLLCAAYVFGCAFRSVLPRADVQRIVLFDTWLSSVAVGRTVATIAEVCFAIQWAIVLHQLGRMTKSDTARNIAYLIVPLILIAECCSWYGVITTNYVGNAIENSIWAVTFLLIAAALLRLVYEFRGVMQLAIGVTIAGIVGYLAFLVTVDVPMYVSRWQADMSSGKEILGFFSGLRDASTRWAVTHDYAQWKDEIAWMSLYFSAAVWSSLALCGVWLFRDRLVHYRVRYRASPARSRPTGHPLPVRASRNNPF